MRNFTSSAQVSGRNSGFLRFLGVLVVMVGMSVLGWGATAIYTVTSTSAVSTTGTTPSGSSASYSQTYTTAKQITSDNSATLTLSGYAGYKITSITLEMKSNTSKGKGTLSVVAGSTTISSINPSAAFNTASWYSSWSTSYVNVIKTPTDYSILNGENIVITIAATESSLYIQKYSITYEAVSTNDQTSKVEAPTNQTATGDIASTVTTSGSAVEVFKFKVSDLGSADGLATKITQVKIKKSSGTADWTDHIAGASLWDGASQITTGTVSITDNDITFPITSGNLDIVNSANKEITMKIWLKSTNIVDNSTMVFMASQTLHGFTADVAGSAFATDFGSAVTSNTMTVRVAATKVSFTTSPSSTTCPNTNFTTSPVVKATDANGTTDADFTGIVTLTNSGSIGMTNYEVNATAGVANFSTLQFTTTGSVTLTAGASGLTSSDPTASITISVGNATSPAASNGNALSVLTWTNPASCYDEIMIVAKSGSAVLSSPSGDGTAYTANLAYGSGTEFDGGYFVYKGTTSSQSVTGLTNETTYYFTLFTRKGSIWSSGITTTATPALASSASDYFRTKTSGNWNSTSTWESSSDNTNWIAATATPTSSANTITILNGHTVTVSVAVTVDQVVVSAGGQITVSSALTIANGVGTDLIVTGTFLNSGSVTLQGTTTTVVNGTFTNSGSMTLNTGTTSVTVNGIFTQTVSTAILNSSAGTISFGSGSEYRHQTNGGTIPTATWNIASTCNVTGMTSSSPSGMGQSFGDLTWNCAQTTHFNVNNASFGTKGKLKVIATGSSNLAIVGSTNTDFTNSFGSIEVTGGVFNLNFVSTSSGGSSTVTSTGDVTVSGTGTVNIVTGSGNPSSSSYMTTLNIGGNLDVSADANFTATSSGTNSFGYIAFNKSGIQTANIASGGTGLRGKSDIDVLAGSTLKLLSNFPLSSRSASDYDILTIEGTLDVGSFVVNQGAVGTAARFTLSSGATLITANPTGIAGSITVGGTKTFNPAANYEFTGSTIGTLPTNAGSIILRNSEEVVVSSNTTATSVTVAPGAKLTLNNGSTFSPGTFVLQSSGSATATFVDARSDENKTYIPATVHQYLPQGRNWYVGIPIVSGIASTLTAAGLSTSVSYWSETAGDWVNNYTGTLTPGIGYIGVSTPAAGSGTNNVSFTGNLNTGNFPVTVTRTVTAANKPGFNLIANPYPSYLNPCALITGKTKLEPTIWYRTAVWLGEPDNKYLYSFETVNTADGVGTNGVTGYIPPMQAFWVRVKPNSNPATNNSEELIFTNAMRYHANPTIEEETITTTLLKAKQSVSKKLIRLRISNGVTNDEAVVYSNANALNSFDKFDSRKMSNDNVAKPEIFTVVNNEQLVINGYNQIPTDVEIPLGFKTGTAGNFTLKANEITNLDANTALIVKDKVLNLEYDLTNGDAYEFNSAIYNSTNRFSIIFKAVGVTTSIDNSKLSTSTNVFVNANGELMVKTSAPLSADAKVSVYNAVGQLISIKPLSSGTSIANAARTAGVYWVKITNDGETITRKVIVN